MFYQLQDVFGMQSIFWEGSHYERMKRYIDNLINDVI
jgi:uncharacterized protein with PIN domain